MERKSHFFYVFKIILIVCILLFPLFWLLSSLIIVGQEDNVVKAELNNQYINTNYSGWQAVELNNGEMIRMPDEWRCRASGSITEICNEHDQVVAKGGKLIYGENSQYLYEPLIADLLEHEVTNVKLTPIKCVRSSEFGTIIITNEDTKEYYYILLSRVGSYDMFFIIETSAMKSYNDPEKILVAIVYSYVFV